MLKFLREHRTGFFGAVVMGLVCLTMIGFGINFFAPQGPTETVIRVNDREVTYAEFQNRLNSYRSMLQQRLGENFEQFAGLVDFEQQTVDQIINQTLLDDFIENNEISPSTSLVHQRISTLPYFGGVMTESNYRAFLQASGMSGPQLEATTRQEIAVSMIQTTFNDVSWPSETELRQAYTQANKEVSYHIAKFSPSDFENQVALDDTDALTAYFEENIEQYRIPAKVQYQAAMFRPQDFMDEVQVTDEDIAYGYERQRNSFLEPAKVSFRRIFLKKNKVEDSNPLEEMMGGNEDDAEGMSTLSYSQQQKAKIELAQQRIEAGEDFATIAKEISDDEVVKADGGLVALTEYSLLNEPLRSALFELEPGEISNILQDAEGYYLLQVEEKVDERTKPLEEVKSAVERRIQSEYAPEYARIAAEEFLESLESEVSEQEFASIAADKNFPLSATAQPLQRGQSSGSIPPAVTEEALVLEAGEIELVEAGDSAYVVRVKELVPSSVPDFSEVVDQVRTDYRRARATLLAEEAAKEFLASLTSSPAKVANFKESAEATAATVETTELAIAGQVSNPALRQPAIAQAVSRLNPKSPVLERVQTSGNDYLVIAFAEQRLPNQEDFLENRDSILAREQQSSGQRLFRTLQTLLRAEAEVWVDPNLLDTSRTQI